LLKVSKDIQSETILSYTILLACYDVFSAFQPYKAAYSIQLAESN